MKENNLSDKEIVFLYPLLAKTIGLNESMLLSWLRSTTIWYEGNVKIIQDKAWAKIPLEQWKSQFCFLSESTIKRALKNLVFLGLVDTENLNENKIDRTLWYSITERGEQCGK